MAKSSSIKVRFNLSAGKNYMKWKVEYPDRKPEYYDPKEVQLVLGGCVLKNRKTTALKIFEGAHKTVCAWVLCQHITIYKAGAVEIAENCHQIKYNPRVRPNWMWGEEVMDGCSLPTMVSEANRLYYHETWKGGTGDHILKRFISANRCSVDY
jgi:hypothetical protein